MAADESTPKHGRHAASQRSSASHARTSETSTDFAATESKAGAIPEVAASASTPAAVPTSAPASTPASIPQGMTPAIPIIDGDQETHMGDAPRPIGVDPQETGSFRRIDASEGARLTTRANASETASSRMGSARPMEAVRMSTAGRPKVDRHETVVQSNSRVFIILGVAALLVVLIVGWLVGRALISVDREEKEVVVEQTQATGAEGIEYRGDTYFLKQQESGVWALASHSEGFEGDAILCELHGTPVTLILFDMVFVIPENLPDGTWDLVAHPLGGGSMTQQVTDQDGNPIVREGQIVEAVLSGSSVVVTTDGGDQVSVSLVAS